MVEGTKYGRCLYILQKVGGAIIVLVLYTGKNWGYYSIPEPPLLPPLLKVKKMLAFKIGLPKEEKIYGFIIYFGLF